MNTALVGERCDHGVPKSIRCVVCDPPARPRGSASGTPSLKYEPRCRRCGTAVSEGVMYCDVCGPIMEQRKGPVARVIIVEKIVEKKADGAQEVPE